ncbi:unnamed protein product [Caretta caretta]
MVNHQRAFESLKKASESLLSHAVLKFPYVSCPFMVACDASKVSVGFALEQIDEFSRCHCMAFGGHKLNERETNYSVTQLECLAIVEAFKAYHPYLLDMEFTVYTDYSAQWWFLTKHNSERHLWRWLHKLSKYTFLFHHKPGKQNLLADAFSGGKGYENRLSMVL